MQLVKGQHVQVIQRLSNEFCLVQLLNSTDQGGGGGPGAQNKQLVEVQVPISLIKCRSNKQDGKLIFFVQKNLITGKLFL